MTKIDEAIKEYFDTYSKVHKETMNRFSSCGSRETHDVTMFILSNKRVRRGR